MADYITLYKDWQNVGSQYQGKHENNYTLIENAINTIAERVNATNPSTQEILQLALLWDRRGIIGEDSFDFSEGVLTGPLYNLSIAAGGYTLGDGRIRIAESATAYSMAGQSTGTYYVNVDSTGTVTVSATASSDSVRSFVWTSTTSTVSSKALYTGVAILLDGDDYAAMLYSSSKVTQYTSVADRLDAIEADVDVWGGLYAQNTPHSGLNFKYKAGKVRNDSVITSTVAGQVALTDNELNYVELDPSTGVVSKNTTSFTSGKIPLYTVITASGAITTIVDVRTAAIAGTGGGGGGHTQGTDLGTTATEFTIDSDATGTPTSRAGLVVEAGDNDNAKWQYNRSSKKWEWSVDGGTTWYTINDPADILGSQEFSKLILQDPPSTALSDSIEDEASVDWTELDLSSLLTDAPNGCHAVILGVFLTDPAITTYMYFRTKGSITAGALNPMANSDQSAPALVVVQPDDDGIIEYSLAAGEAGNITVGIIVYLYGVVAKVTGVGTQDRIITQTGIAVSAGSSATQNITGFFNRGLVHYLKVEETGGGLADTYDIEFYGKDTFLAADLMYKAEGIDPAISDFEDWLPWWYKDKDGTSELHVKITNNDSSNAGTFTITLEAEQFA